MPVSDIESIRALAAEAQENTTLVQELYAHVARDPRAKSWPNFKAIDIEALEELQKQVDDPEPEPEPEPDK